MKVWPVSIIMLTCTLYKYYDTNLKFSSLDAFSVRAERILNGPTHHAFRL